MESKTVYLVTSDGWNEGWGTEIYCVGIFSDENEANKVARKNEGDIFNIELNKCYNMHKNNHDRNYSNELYLGGYIE